MTIFIGVDAGINGAIAFINDRHQHARAMVFDLPRHPFVHRLDGYALATLMRKHAPADEDSHVYLEALHPSGGHSGGAGTMQVGSMMKSYGIVLGAIDCTRFPLTEVGPRIWKKFFGLVSVKDKKVTKADSLALARRLYPEAQDALKRQKDDGRAEAMLLAHWGRATAAGSYESQDMEAAL